jgi:hypothetical protein
VIPIAGGVLRVVVRGLVVGLGARRRSSLGGIVVAVSVRLGVAAAPLSHEWICRVLLLLRVERRRGGSGIPRSRPLPGKVVYRIRRHSFWLGVHGRFRVIETVRCPRLERVVG